MSTCHHCNPTHDLGDDCTIPEAPWYVVSTDTFMSGWGYGKSKDNVCVVPCASYEEAERVERYVRSRGDQKRVRINSTRPRPRSWWLLTNLHEWKDTAARNGF